MDPTCTSELQTIATGGRDYPFQATQPGLHMVSSASLSGSTVFNTNWPQKRDEDRPIILLLDEPGFKFATALGRQADFLRYIDDLASKHQVIYSNSFAVHDSFRQAP